jgi:hypothetical protein
MVAKNARRLGWLAQHEYRVRLSADVLSCLSLDVAIQALDPTGEAGAVVHVV